MNPSNLRFSGPLLASLFAAGVLGLSVPAAPAAESAVVDAEERPVIGIERQGPIKVVFQATSGATKNGVSKALNDLKKIHAGYLAAGIDPERVDIRAVFHGEAADHLLTNEAWNRVRGESHGNPSAELIRELAAIGVSVELCDSRRTENGWSKSDVHEDVLLVKGAYHRIADLQLQGYAYIRF